MKTITREELRAALQSPEPPVLLEALPPSYFEVEHLPGAQSLPLDDVERLASTLVPDQTAKLVTYCSGPTCPNSKLAAEHLERKGYTNINVYEGGKADWAAAGLLFESGSSEAVA